MKLVLKVLTIVTLSCLVYGEDDFCIAPTGKAGVCVLITECQKLQNLIKGSQGDRELLKQWHCGFEKDIPKVCCLHKYSTNTTTTEAPIKYTCYTLEATPGTCVDIGECPALAERLKQPVKANDLEYVQRSRCIAQDPNKYSVCCENPSTTNSTNSTELNRNSGSTTCKSSGLPDPNTDCCGVDSAGGNRIIHGEPASIDQYPWLAVIEYSRPYLCGGSLISSRYVLTAAHCVVTNTLIDRGAKSVRLGEYNTTNPGQDCVDVEGGGVDCTDGTVTLDIIEKIYHPEFNADKVIVFANDIAVLKLSDAAPFTDFIRPICLPTSDLTQSPPNVLRFYIAGWGAVDEFRSKSDIKLHADIPHINLEQCVKLYSRTGSAIVWNKQVCAGGELNRDSCKGDSGGPLMYLNDKKYELTGIISYGTVQCGNKGQPSVYTKVHEYVPWIKSVIDS